VMTIARVAKMRAPYLSERYPVSGPIIENPRIIGIMYTPAQNGVSL
jgi:hypothetical protein